MLVTPCPRCGRPAPLAIAAPDTLRCPACGHAGAPPAEITERLRAAAKVLAGLDARERQLTSAQRRAVAGMRWRRGFYRGLFALVLLPFLFFAAVGVWGTLHEGGLRGALVGFALIGPFVVLLAGGVATARWLGRRVDRLVRACAATPPHAPGEPAGCHLCGAPLTPARAEPFCRCGHCQADNLVDAGALAAAGDRRAAALDGWEAEIGARAQAVGDGAGWASLAVLGLAVFAPIGVFLLFWATAFALFQIEGAPNTALEYATVEHGSVRCIGQLARLEGGQGQLDFSPYPPKGLERYVTRALGELAPFPVTALEGRAVRDEDGVWRIARVYGTPTGSNALVLENARGMTKRRAPVGECLLDLE